MLIHQRLFRMGISFEYQEKPVQRINSYKHTRTVQKSPAITECRQVNSTAQLNRKSAYRTKRSMASATPSSSLLATITAAASSTCAPTKSVTLLDRQLRGCSPGVLVKGSVDLSNHWDRTTKAYVRMPHLSTSTRLLLG